LFCLKSQLKSGETAANIARELAEQTRNHLNAGDITYSVRAMDQLVGLLDVQLRNLTPGGKDSAARSLNKVRTLGVCIVKGVGRLAQLPCLSFLPSVELDDSKEN
jgi:hypothetical protein